MFMFIRWKRKACAPKRDYINGGYSTDYLLYAQLIQSFREEGKPRQRVIAHLGSIRESKLLRASCRLWFWEKANDRLNTLSLDPVDLSAIKELINKRVARLSASEQEQIEAERRAIWGTKFK